MERNLTTGSVFKNIVFFSLPYLLSYFLQTLYGMADLFIIGQFEGTASTTAVSIGSQVMHMLTVMIVGLAMGSTVSIGQSVGANDKKRAAVHIGNTVTLFLSLSIVLTVVLVLLVHPIVNIMSTPTEAVSGTVAYLTICFIGIPFITAYNIISSIFRGLGDSKSPMYFIAVACVANIGLDYLFIGAMRLGAAGAALGTTLAQAVSVGTALLVIGKRKTGIVMEKAHFKPKRPVLGNLLKIGVPIAVQDGLIQVAFLLITIIANRRGLIDAAAVGIVEKIIGFVFLVPSSCRFCPRCAEFRRPQAGTGSSYAALCYFHRLRLRVYCLRFGSAHRGTGGGAVHQRQRSTERRRAVFPWVHLGLHLCRHPLQLQRLFLCL